MKWKLTMISIGCVALLLASVSLSNGFFKSDVGKAKEFMQAGMYPQAIELLNKAITDKPTDAEAHFQLASCYINTGDYRGAAERFGSAVRLKPDYGYQIGEEYRKAGTSVLNQGRVDQAKELFTKAVKYQPNLKNEIAKKCLAKGTVYLDGGQISYARKLFNTAVEYQPSLKETVASDCVVKGQNYLKRGHINKADELFSVAVSYDGTLREDVGDKFSEMGNSSSDTKKHIFYEKAGKYNRKYNWIAGQKLMEIAYKQRSIESRNEYLEKALECFNREPVSTIEVDPPSGLKLDTQGRLVGSLKPGQKLTCTFKIPKCYSTPWIIIPIHKYRFNFSHLKPVIIDNGYKKAIVRHEDYYDLGIVTGEVKLKFTAIESTDCVFKLRRE